MNKVYGKASQLRDRKAFRGWLFKLANNTSCEHYGKRTRDIATVTLDDIQVATGMTQAGNPAFKFLHWMTFLDSAERKVMKQRFLEHWEYHEIPALKTFRSERCNGEYSTRKKTGSTSRRASWAPVAKPFCVPLFGPLQANAPPKEKPGMVGLTVDSSSGIGIEEWSRPETVSKFSSARHAEIPLVIPIS